MGNALDIIVMVGQLILALSILVGVHEGGHLLAAKLFGMRVEQFSIGFPPKIFGFKYGETVYSIGAIPLGGFVKISGMIDESLDTKTMDEEPQPWEFRSKPAWQRLIVMLGGIIVNVITGIIIFILLTFSLGESDFSMSVVNKNGIAPGDLGKQIGFEIGDKIVAINGQPFEMFADISKPSVLLESTSYYTVQRGDEKLDIKIPPGFIEKFSSKNARANFVIPVHEFAVGSVSKGSGADKGGLKKGDIITAIDGRDIRFFHEYERVIADYADKQVTLDIKRPMDKEMTQYNIMKLSGVQVSEDAKLGFIRVMLLEETTIKYSFMEAIPKGTTEAFSVVWLNAKAFGKMFSGELSPTKNLKGPLGIMKEFGPTWDWVRFWTLTGLISMILAFMNLLPIPALDGGHVVFLIYEIVSGRKPSDKFLENAQKVGMVLLLGLMVFVIFNDIVQGWFQ